MALRKRLRRLRTGIQSKLERAGSQLRAPIGAPRNQLAEPGAEPPVVARLIVEVRSDGARTIARGALEGGPNGEYVAIEARGTTPLELAASLARAALRAPMLFRAAASAAERSLPRQQPPGAARPRQPR